MVYFIWTCQNHKNSIIICPQDVLGETSSVFYYNEESNKFGIINPIEVSPAMIASGRGNLNYFFLYVEHIYVLYS